MLKKRIIPCLDIKDGRAVKGVNFVNLRDAGDPIELAKRYVAEGADELVFLDITANVENRKTALSLVENLAEAINIPFTVGGGVNNLKDARKLISSGADKVSINSAAVRSPLLLSEISGELGSQCVVVAIDIKKVNNVWKVFVSGGSIETDLIAHDWAREVEALGAGEILLTVMDQDGTKLGFGLDITQEITSLVNIPVIASGGAGTKAHFLELFTQTRATGGLAASIFHFGEIPIPELKRYLKGENIPIRIYK